MHVYFIGIGGTAIGPLALIALQNGYTVSGSDKQNSQYIEYLAKHGINDVHIGHTAAHINVTHEKNPIDWVVHSSAVSIENPNNPEIIYAREQGINVTKRDEFLNDVLERSGKKLIAVAGTHGKTTTTAMAVWLFKDLGLPISYSVGAKISFGDMGHFDEKSEYFVYECDEFDHNFLAFSPYASMITGIDYDHHEIFPTRQSYQDAFRQFIGQSKHNLLWQSDVSSANLTIKSDDIVLNDNDEILNTLSIIGMVNRRNAFQVAHCLSSLLEKPVSELLNRLERFPGLNRRFEKIAENLYTDYAHTPPKIAGCLQLAFEISKNVVVVYEPLTNRRQHFIKNEYHTLFNGIRRLYWVPSYLAREDPKQHILTPPEFVNELANKHIAEPAELNDHLKAAIESHLNNGDLVVCMSGGGGGSLDEWLRNTFKNSSVD